MKNIELNDMKDVIEYVKAALMSKIPILSPFWSYTIVAPTEKLHEVKLPNGEIVDLSFVETACAYKNYIIFNEDFLISLMENKSSSEFLGNVAFVLLHEVFHIFNMHSVRVQNRDPMLWNIATDLAINGYLHTLAENHSSIIKLPVDKNGEHIGLFPKGKFERFANKTAEEIYDELLKSANQNQNQCKSCSKGKSSSSKQSTQVNAKAQSNNNVSSGRGKLTREELEDIMREYQKRRLDEHKQWEKASETGLDSKAQEEIKRMAAMAEAMEKELSSDQKDIGLTGLGVLRQVNDIIRKVTGQDADEIINRIISMCRVQVRNFGRGEMERNLLKPMYHVVNNKGSITPPMHRPKAAELVEGQIVFAVDTSGSISMDDLTTFLNYIYIVLSKVKANKTFNRIKVAFFTFDAEKQGEVIFNLNEIKNADQFKKLVMPQIIGGGGTIIFPVFKRIEELFNEGTLDKSTPTQIIVISDMYIADLDALRASDFNINEFVLKNTLWIRYDPLSDPNKPFNVPFGFPAELSATGIRAYIKNKLPAKNKEVEHLL